MQFGTKTPNKRGLFIPFDIQYTNNFEKNTHFTKAIIHFYFVYIALKIYIILLQIFFHKNILLYKSVCINIRGVASCRRNIV